ncbi:MAG TPA: radical SAM protein, partial [Candidatus Binatia bacterium]|nr:radical SAM protein [Candidatus Binatia bacterium]
MPVQLLEPRGQLLKRTSSRCPVCHVPCPAEVWKTAERPPKVFLRRTCPTHGEFSACIASDARFYWLAKGNPANANGCCGGTACCAADGSTSGTLGRNAKARGDAPFETLSTCLALIEIVRSCNLSCPTCYADSPVGIGSKLDAVPLAELQSRIQGVIDRKGPIEILQLSGGEPTLHPHFFELLAWAQANPGIQYLLLNTNGVRLAREPAFTARLGQMFARGLQVYLQFDGVQAAGQEWLRGADLRELREEAIRRCGEAGI